MEIFGIFIPRTQALVCRSAMSLSAQDAKRPGNGFMLSYLVVSQYVAVLLLKLNWQWEVLRYWQFYLEISAYSLSIFMFTLKQNIEAFYNIPYHSVS